MIEKFILPRIICLVIVSALGLEAKAEDPPPAVKCEPEHCGNADHSPGKRCPTVSEPFCNPPTNEQKCDPQPFLCNDNTIKKCRATYRCGYNKNGKKVACPQGWTEEAHCSLSRQENPLACGFMICKSGNRTEVFECHPNQSL